MSQTKYHDHMNKAPILLNSITDADTNEAGEIAVSGSHGGVFAAALASRAGLRAVILNDAGTGLDGAGIAGVKALANVGMAACAVDCMSAEIGSARDMLDHGRLSYANAIARDLGARAGQSVAEGLVALRSAPLPHDILPEIPEARWTETVGQNDVLCVDSASLITPADAGRLIVTGSHGGLIGGDPKRACKACARLVSFSDAGGGKNGIGMSRLPALDLVGVAAVTLDCMTCAIGNAASALASGRISACNETAQQLGAAPGQLLKDLLASLPSNIDQ